MISDPCLAQAGTVAPHGVCTEAVSGSYLVERLVLT